MRTDQEMAPAILGLLKEILTDTVMAVNDIEAHGILYRHGLVNRIASAARDLDKYVNSGYAVD